MMMMSAGGGGGGVGGGGLHSENITKKSISALLRYWKRP
jgi:hypothetical protein